MLGVLMPLWVLAEVGGIRGMVMDQDFEVPLPGVKVRISETGQEAETSEGGSYVFESIEPGGYTLLFSKGGYTRVTRPEVVVTAGSLAEVDVEMAGEYEEMDELVVRDIQLGGASEIGLLNLRMESSALMDSVGSDLMGKAGASDAAQALTLVPGTTVQDGKYAVVRGLPDRYVSTQMNGVRLPTADPDKRAVQLDQFPAAMIESMQVSKTFTPDQQGDASGGAVNVVLKGVPDGRILKAGFGMEFNTQVLDAGDQFLTYTGGGVDAWGNDAGSIRPQPAGTVWNGAVGVSRGDAPMSYKLGVTAGDKMEFDTGVKVGAFGSFFYKRDASYFEGGVDDRYWQESPGAALTPQFSGNANLKGNMFNTSLYDATQATDELQWGSLGAIGIESENHAVNLLYSHTFSAEDTATLLENTRGKYYFFPGHDPYDPNTPGHYNDPVNGEDNTEGSRFRRSETLEYVERVSDTLQLHGTHVLPFPDLGIGSVFRFLDPEADWTVASSSSRLDSPDKRLFESFWLPPYLKNNDPARPKGNEHQQVNDGSAGGLGNLYRVWKTVEEDSSQYFVNGTLPFEQWSGDKGFLKLGFFNDEVTRQYRQESFNSDPSIGGASSAGDWQDLWSARYPDEGHVINAADIDVDYDGDQQISAWYYMLDVPVSSFLKLTGGTRFEKTDISTTITDADGGNLLLFLPPNYNGIDFQGNEDLANASLSQSDVLPSLGFELVPADKWVFRGSYSETVARMTFKELTPIQQQDYLGGDVFIGNPDLQMSSLKNYDLRLDYNPYPGGLVSFSWFYKDITDPIEYRQVLLDSTLATTAENFPEGTINGYEAEVRQSLGRFWNSLEGLSVGGNITLIESDVELSAKALEEMKNVGAPRSSRPMLNAPEYLYNLNAAYSIPKFGAELGIFYVVKGDTLVTGGGNANGNFSPDVYATERGTLNLTLSKKLGDHLKLNLSAKNITDSKVQEVYRSDYVPGGDVVKRSYKTGVDYSIGLSAKW